MIDILISIGSAASQTSDSASGSHGALLYSTASRGDDLPFKSIADCITPSRRSRLNRIVDGTEPIVGSFVVLSWRGTQNTAARPRCALGWRGRLTMLA
jgi:hypothetical protein